MSYPQRLLFLFAAASLFAAAHAAPPAQPLPNIVIILVDDMGYGDPGFNNPNSKITTPNLDRLAKSGMRFTDAHAPGPLCHMSRYGLMTGRYPFRANVGRWPKQPVIETDQTTIASLAKTQGYHTEMVGKWHLGFQENGYDKPLPGGPVDRGFDSFFGIRASTDIPPYFYIRDNHAVEPPTDHIAANSSKGGTKFQGEFWREGGIAPNLALKDVLPRFTEEALKVVQSHAAQPKNTRKPLMLYLAYPAPHTPWLPSPEFAGKSKAGMYGDFVMMVDQQIGRVLTALDDTDLAKDTLLIFTSDNGPLWYDQDVKRFGHDSSGGLRGMKADAWEAGHRMPFLIRWPDHVTAGTSSDQLVCFTDFLATFAELFNAELPEKAGPDSFSFLSAMKQRAASKPARNKFVMRPGSKKLMSIRSGDWKLITGLGSGGFSQPSTRAPKPDEAVGQLYNLRDDQGETKNLYKNYPEIVDRLTTEMQKITEQGRSR